MLTTFRGVEQVCGQRRGFPLKHVDDDEVEIRLAAIDSLGEIRGNQGVDALLAWQGLACTRRSARRP
jgi:hypothetical protein